MTSAVLDALGQAARAAWPDECCGILLGEAAGEGGVVTAMTHADNVHPSPKTHFEIDPQALVDAHRTARSGGPRVLGYYHSHPSGTAEPSATDRVLAQPDGKVWAIIGLADPDAEPAIRFWRAVTSGFDPLPLLRIER